MTASVRSAKTSDLGLRAQLPRVWLGLLACVLPLAGQAGGSAVWRCDQGGRTSYTDAPCAGGHEVRAEDPRDAAQVAAAKQRLRALVAESRRLSVEREQRERQQAALGPAAGLSGFVHTPLQAGGRPASKALNPPRPTPRPSAARTSAATAPVTRHAPG